MALVGFIPASKVGPDQFQGIAFEYAECVPHPHQMGNGSLPVSNPPRASGLAQIGPSENK